MNIEKKGFSLIEILIVISVVLGVMVSAFYIFYKVENNYRVKKEVDRATNLTSEYSSLYSNATFYKNEDSASRYTALIALMSNKKISDLKTSDYAKIREGDNGIYLSINDGSITDNGGVSYQYQKNSSSKTSYGNYIVQLVNTEQKNPFLSKDCVPYFTQIMAKFSVVYFVETQGGFTGIVKNGDKNAVSNISSACESFGNSIGSQAIFAFY